MEGDKINNFKILEAGLCYSTSFRTMDGWLSDKNFKKDVRDLEFI